MPAITTTTDHVTFVNTFRCAPADQAEVVAINRDIVERVAAHRPGFVSASIHASTDGTRVFNYLQWETAEDLAAMQRSPEFRAIAQRFAGRIEFEPHRCDVVHVRDGGTGPPKGEAGA
jgi:antibiotic biosynthesis monooxygenase (ABM) superfamily enzyme